MVSFNISDLYNKEELLIISKSTIAEIEEKYVLGRMERINNITGQENSPRYIAYVLQYTANKLFNN